MNCQRCHVSPATCHFVTIENGVLSEAHLCVKCAGAFASSNVPVRKADPVKKACPDCGCTFKEILERRRMGCPTDYHHFKEVEEIVRQLHGASRHVGKCPSAFSAGTPGEPAGRPPQKKEEEEKKAELAALAKELDEAVKAENFERAAQIRDRIRAILAGQDERSK